MTRLPFGAFPLVKMMPKCMYVCFRCSVPCPAFLFLRCWTTNILQVLKYHVLSGQTDASGLPATATSMATLSTDSQLSLKNTAPQVTSVGYTPATTASVVAADLMVS